MKRKILFTALFLIAIIAIPFQTYSEKVNLSNLMLENVEALASGETGSMTRCVGTGSVDCPINHVKVEYVISGYSLDGLY